MGWHRGLCLRGLLDVIFLRPGYHFDLFCFFHQKVILRQRKKDHRRVLFAGDHQRLMTVTDPVENFGKVGPGMGITDRVQGKPPSLQSLIFNQLPDLNIT